MATTVVADPSYQRLGIAVRAAMALADEFEVTIASTVPR